MRAKYLQLALLASRAALKHGDLKHYQVGAAAIRGDGTLVSSGNGPALGPTPDVHAEARLCAKLDRDAVVFVVRVRRDGSLGMAMPCVDCKQKLLQNGAKKVFYTDDSGSVKRLW